MRRIDNLDPLQTVYSLWNFSTASDPGEIERVATYEARCRVERNPESGHSQAYLGSAEPIGEARSIGRFRPRQPCRSAEI